MPTTKSTKKTTTKKVASKKVERKAAVKAAPKETKETVVHETPANTQTPSFKEMTRNPRFWLGLAVVVLAVLLYAGRGLFVAATVNNEPISRLEVVQQLEKQNGKQELNTLITQKLIQQEAQKRHISVTQQDVDAEMNKIENSLKGQGLTLDQALASRGMTRKDVEQQIVLQKELDKMVGQDVKVSDQDVQDYIDKNKDTLPQDLSDDQLKTQVRQQLEQQQLQDKTQTFVQKLEQSAKITTFVNY